MNSRWPGRTGIEVPGAYLEEQYAVHGGRFYLVLTTDLLLEPALHVILLDGSGNRVIDDVRDLGIMLLGGGGTLGTVEEDSSGALVVSFAGYLFRIEVHENPRGFFKKRHLTVSKIRCGQP